MGQRGHVNGIFANGDCRLARSGRPRDASGSREYAAAYPCVLGIALAADTVESFGRGVGRERVCCVLVLMSEVEGSQEGFRRRRRDRMRSKGGDGEGRGRVGSGWLKDASVEEVTTLSVQERRKEAGEKEDGRKAWWSLRGLRKLLWFGVVMMAVVLVPVAVGR